MVRVRQRALFLFGALATACGVEAGTVYARYLTLYNAPQWNHGAGDHRIINLQEVQAYEPGGSTLLKPDAITSSKLWESYPSQNYIDGSFQTLGHSHMDDPYPWVRIDYGAGAKFGKIVITNRRTGNVEALRRSAGMKVTLSDTICKHAPRDDKGETSCSDVEVWTGVLSGVNANYVFDNLPNKNKPVPTTTSTTSTTTISSTTWTNPLVQQVDDMQGKLDGVQRVMEEQIKQNEAQVGALKDLVKQQGDIIKGLQDHDEQQQAMHATYVADQAAKEALKTRQLSDLYEALAALSAPLPDTVERDAERKCAGNAGRDAESAIEVTGSASTDDRVLSLSVCDGKVELNSEKCSVDPCDLAQYIKVLRSRLSTLTDI